MIYWLWLIHVQKSSGACQISPERIVLDLESEVIRGASSIPTGGKIVHIFFQVVKASVVNIGLIANFV